MCQGSGIIARSPNPRNSGVASSPLDLCAVWGTQWCFTRSDSGSGFQFPPPSDRRRYKFDLSPDQKRRIKAKIGGSGGLFLDTWWISTRKHQKTPWFWATVKHQRFGRIGIPAFEKPYLFGSRLTVKPEILGLGSFLEGTFWGSWNWQIIGLRMATQWLDQFGLESYTTRFVVDVWHVWNLMFFFLGAVFMVVLHGLYATLKNIKSVGRSL